MEVNVLLKQLINVLEFQTPTGTEQIVSVYLDLHQMVINATVMVWLLEIIAKDAPTNQTQPGLTESVNVTLVTLH
jgi:hypothetical protein